MNSKIKAIIYTSVFVVSLLLQSLIPIFSKMNDFLYIIPLIGILVLFLVYNHFAIRKMKYDYKKEKYDINQYKERRKIIILCMLIELVLLIAGIILFNTI
jgi:uncharacterized membrane protein